MREFFKDFFREHRVRISLYSLLRIFSFCQVLFLPYAFSKIVNILSSNPDNWREAIPWTVLMILNGLTDDFVRLRAKFGLENIGSKLKISLATFLSQKTAIRKGKKTGEAVQAVKKTSEDIESLISFYKNDALQLPVNLIVIPLVLFNASRDYLILLLVYGVLYLIIEYFVVKIYRRELRKYFEAAEVFWGTAYRKTPEIWRKREDDHAFARNLEKEGRELYQATVLANNANNWRWIFLQCLSSASIGVAVLFVIYKIITNTAQVGDLILVSAYFERTQEALNIITLGITYIIETKVSLKRLNEAVKIK